MWLHVCVMCASCVTSLQVLKTNGTSLNYCTKIMGSDIDIIFCWTVPADQHVCSQPFDSNYSVVRAWAEKASQCGNKCYWNDCVRRPEGGELSAGTWRTATWVPAHGDPTNQGWIKSTYCDVVIEVLVSSLHKPSGTSLKRWFSTSWAPPDSQRQKRRKVLRVKRSLAGPNWPCKESARPACQVVAGWRSCWLLNI